MRTVIGFFSGWIMSILIASMFGLVFCFYMLEGQRIDFLNTISHGGSDALNVLTFVVGTIAVASAVLSFVLTIIIAIPLYVISIYQRKTSICVYLFSGLIIAASSAVLVVSIQVFFFPQALLDIYIFEVVSMLFAGPAYTLTFWFLVLRNSDSVNHVNK